MRGGHILESGNFGWRLILKLQWTESIRGEQFHHACWLRSWTPPVSPGWQVCVVHQLQVPWFPSLQGFLQSLAVVCPLCSTLPSIPLGCRSCVWGVIVEHSSQGAEAVLCPVISIALQLMLGCECNFSVSTYFLLSFKTKEPHYFMKGISEGAEHWGRSKGWSRLAVWPLSHHLICAVFIRYK